MFFVNNSGQVWNKYCGGWELVEGITVKVDSISTGSPYILTSEGQIVDCISYNSNLRRLNLEGYEFSRIGYVGIHHNIQMRQSLPYSSFIIGLTTKGELVKIIHRPTCEVQVIRSDIKFFISHIYTCLILTDDNQWLKLNVLDLSAPPKIQPQFPPFQEITLIRDDLLVTKNHIFSIDDGIIEHHLSIKDIIRFYDESEPRINILDDQGDLYYYNGEKGITPVKNQVIKKLNSISKWIQLASFRYTNYLINDVNEAYVVEGKHNCITSSSLPSEIFRD